jgi:hypothetical protein
MSNGLPLPLPLPALLPLALRLLSPTALPPTPPATWPATALRRRRPNPARGMAACGAALALALPALARADGERRATTATPAPALVQQECAACHVVYAPGLLPAASWQRLMAKLPRHFGVDASMDAAGIQAITAWLAAGAGSGKRASVAPPEDRITRSAWFMREHRKLPAATWRRPAIQSPAQCSACHRGAEQGDFDEHRVRIPD